MRPASRPPSRPARVGGSSPAPRGAGVYPRARGYTLLEILTVIVLVGLLAAIASPSFIRLMRDRGVSRSTLHLMDALRTARARALEREVMVVRWNAAGGPGGVPRLELWEAFMVEVGAQPPTCAGIAWGPGSPSSRLLAGMNFSQNPGNAQDTDESGATELAPPVFSDPSGNAQPFVDLCFTGRGKAFVRYAAGDPWSAFTGVASIAMVNKRTNFKRTIFIPPSAPARVAL
ncbi:MAG TPA: prepilin-type N-terminal cleavage/methylation domain-containing protein [Polyangiaceae bacterium]|nr:prepilin-type N-terminal cleavage/methylation domain-containing protein [Polyangiaceae bacterium]